MTLQTETEPRELSNQWKVTIFQDFQKIVKILKSFLLPVTNVYRNEK